VESIELACRLEVFAHLVSEAAFNQLRTNEQLGYLVWSGAQNVKGVLGFRVIVQSGDKPADFLEQRIEAFLNQYKDELASLSEATYRENLAAVIAQKLEKDKTLNEESTRHWNEISKHHYVFNRVDLEVNVLKTLKLEDIVQFFQSHILVNSPTRRKMSVQVFGNLFTVPEEGKFVPHSTTAATNVLTTETSQGTEPAARSIPTPPPVPNDGAPITRLSSSAKFKRSMPLFPNLV